MDNIDLSNYDKTSIELTLSIKAFEDKINSAFSMAMASNTGIDPDLMFLHFILCHEKGNTNWDYFKKDVLARAYQTCVNKPIDLEHGQPIIGVMTDSVFKSPEEELSFVECLGVIWKFVYPDEAKEIKQKAEAGLLKVSMECYFHKPDYMVNEQIYDYDTAVLMGLDKFHKQHQPYMGQPVFRVFKDVIFGGVGVVKNPADKQAHILAVANEDGKVEINEELTVLIQEMMNSLDGLDAEEKENRILNLKQYIQSQIKEEEVEDIFEAPIDEEKVEENDVAKAETALNEGLEEVSVKADGVAVTPLSNGVLDMSKGSEVYAMNFEELLKQLKEVQAGLVDETLQNALAGVMEALPEVVKEIEVQVEVPVESPELVAKASDLEAKANELETKLAEVEQEFASYKSQIETEKAEATAIALATERVTELESLGIKFSEARASKVFDKLRAMAEDEYVDYKEELLDAMASKIKEEEEKEDEEKEAEATEKEKEDCEDEDVEVDEEDKAKAALNIEIPEGVENPFMLLWK